MFACLRRLSQEALDATRLSRGFASTSTRLLPRQAPAENEIDEQDVPQELTGEAGSKVIVYRKSSRRMAGDDPIAEPWLNGAGSVYRHSKKGPNWLGGDCPFPLNPTFNPPPPVSSKTRDAIYASFLRGSEVRWLSTAYGISLKRVDAILRLKGLEESWKKNKPLQTGFLAGMEYMLQPRTLTLSGHNSAIEARLADQQDEAQGADSARDRYQRLFWEPVAENEDAVVPAAIEQGNEEIRKARQEKRDYKSDPVLLTGRKFPKGSDRARPPKVMFAPSGSAPGRPLIKFLDVGGKFIDVEDRERRMKHGGKRLRSHVKRSLKLG